MFYMCMCAQACWLFVTPRPEARIVKWAAISFSEGSSWPTDWTRVSCISRWILHHWATWEVHFATWMFLYFGSCQYFPTESNLSWHNMPYPVAIEVHLYFQSSESALWALMNLSRQFLNFWHWSTVTLTVVKLSSRKIQVWLWSLFSNPINQFCKLPQIPFGEKLL